MKNIVFISGSISIKKLPIEVINSINKIIEHNIHISVGDADGVDKLIQDFCLSQNYTNLTIYSIYSIPRYKASTKFNFKHIIPNKDIKKEREKQQEKDKAMTLESEFSFVIWDGKSKGSYANLIRALDNKRKIKLYNNINHKFMEQSKINKAEIEFIYRENNGYTASEIIQYLKNELIDIFQRTQDLNKYLVEKSIIKKEQNIYLPIDKYQELFIINKYKGKIQGIKFKNEFISWIEKNIDKPKYIQASLF